MSLYRGTVSRGACPADMVASRSAPRNGIVMRDSLPRPRAIRSVASLAEGICYTRRRARSLGLQLFEIFAPELRHLGRDHGAAIGLVGIAAVVLPVVLLGRIERGERHDLRDDRVIEYVLRLELAHDFLGHATLLVVMIEDRRAILCPHVATLRVEGSRIVESEEHPEQVAITDDRGIEGDLHDLGVAGRAGAHGLIARIGDVAAGVARLDLADAPQLLEDRLEAPEAAAGESSELHQGVTR